MDQERRVNQAGEARLARVESVRALAALGVLVGHLWAEHNVYGLSTISTYPRRLVFGLTSGVWIFFGLTGYLLFWPFVRQAFGDGGRIDLRRYAINRALRILPLYFVAVVILLLLQVDHPTRELWWRHLLLVQTFWRDTASRVDAPLWSVVVELQFYALLPLLALGITRFARGSLGRAFAAVLLLGAAGIVARQLLALSVHDAATTLWAFQLPTTFGFFAAGMSVALLRAVLERSRPAWVDGPLGRRPLWLAVAVVPWAVSCWHFGLANLMVPGVFLAVGAVVLPLRPWRGLEALDWRPLALLGVVSYSLYVWHLPIERWLVSHVGRFSVALFVITGACIVAAAVSYLIFERPALALRRRWAPASPARTLPAA